MAKSSSPLAEPCPVPACMFGTLRCLLSSNSRLAIMTDLRIIKLALDWLPNTIHTGLYIAQEKGFYAALGLKLELIGPDATYSKTPAKRLEHGEADLAICPSESCIAYAQSGKMRLKAIYAILQRDASAIVSTKLSRISELGSGKVYGSYNARYEDDIVKAMIKQDGGNGDGVSIAKHHGMLSLYDSLLSGEVDATWVFMPWEGEIAVRDGVELQAFRAEDYGIPYGYTVIAYDAAAGSLSPETLHAFVSATREGYAYAIENADEAARIMAKDDMTGYPEDFLRKSQLAINSYYSSGKVTELGKMTEERWSTWVKWLESQSLLLASSIDIRSLYINP